MKQVQDALQNTRIPVMAGVWRATSPNQNPPVQSTVYSTTTTEDAHQDDGVVCCFILMHRLCLLPIVLI